MYKSLRGIRQLRVRILHKRHQRESTTFTTERFVTRLAINLWSNLMRSGWRKHLTPKARSARLPLVLHLAVRPRTRSRPYDKGLAEHWRIGIRPYQAHLIRILHPTLPGRPFLLQDLAQYDRSVTVTVVSCYLIRVYQPARSILLAHSLGPCHFRSRGHALC